MKCQPLVGLIDEGSNFFKLRIPTLITISGADPNMDRLGPVPFQPMIDAGGYAVRYS
jgi:hypothetical protein